MNNTIAIAGMGWLGLPLAQKLSTLGYSIKGSVTTSEKARALKNSGFDVYTIKISEESISGELGEFLMDATVLIVLIPPGLRSNTGGNYVKKMGHFLSEIEKNGLKKVVFVSSTAVYDDAQGVVTEKDKPSPNQQKGIQLLQTEELFTSSNKLSTSIVRFGGLIGGNRQPIRYLAGRKDLIDGAAPVNLIRREDCINILVEIIKQDAFGHIFNAVAPEHPSKKEYYTQKALELKLVPPIFSETDNSINFKQVESENLVSILGYHIKYNL